MHWYDIASLLLLLGAVLLSALAFANARRSARADAQRTRELAEAITAATQRQLQDELERSRRLYSETGMQTRQELSMQLEQLRQGNQAQYAAFQSAQSAQWEAMRKNMDDLREANAARDAAFHRTQSAQWEAMRRSMDDMRTLYDTRMLEMQRTMDTHLLHLQQNNEKKLDEMRTVVDEKLNRTLEERLGSSFKLVSDQLEQVYKNLGEMRSLSRDMGDIKNIFANVKTRGTWGEVQLGALLESMLTPDQYAAQVRLTPRSAEAVDYAIRLPGADEDATVYLPIDSKFPLEDYDRMMDALDAGDTEGYNQASRALEARILQEARSIRDKYILPPTTTDFAILFVPIESLFAEVLRRPGLSQRLQMECRVTIAGPTTLAALLNSLRMGFRTLAIQKRSGEVWKLLGAVKKQFGSFAESLSAVERHLGQATSAVQKATDRTAQIQKRLSKVEELPQSEAQQLLPLGEDDA